MTLQEAKTLHAYNSWANNRVFDAVEKLPNEVYFKDMQSSHKNIHETLIHIVGAEKVWVERFQGNPQPFLSQNPPATLTALKTIWEQVGFNTAKWIGAMSDKKLSETFEMKTLKGEVFRHLYWQAFQHMINHGTYHRGQITTMLRQLGEQPVATDLILFYREARK